MVKFCQGLPLFQIEWISADVGVLIVVVIRRFGDALELVVRAFRAVGVA